MIFKYKPTKVWRLGANALAIMRPNGTILWRCVRESYGAALDQLKIECPDSTFEELEVSGWRIIPVGALVEEA